jgi:predicted DNA-binding ribbon-helix-helix protein
MVPATKPPKISKAKGKRILTSVTPYVHKPIAGKLFPMLSKKSFTLSGHRTSVALEAEFWAVLGQSAQDQGISLAALVARIDASRGGRPLASALRLYALAARP